MFKILSIKKFPISYIQNLSRSRNDFILKTFALKEFRKPKLCKTINFTTEFYLNIVNMQREELKNLLRNKNFHLDPKFLANAFRINRYYEDDQEIYGLIQEKLIHCAINGGIKTKSIYFELFETFFENLKSNPDHPLSKNLIATIQKQSYLFTEDEKEEFKKMLTKKTSALKKEFEEKLKLSESDLDEENSEQENEEEEKREKKNKKISEKTDEKLIIQKNQKIEEIDKIHKRMESDKTVEESGDLFVMNFNKNLNVNKNLPTPKIAKLKLKDENIQLYLDEGRNKLTIKSKHFKSKIKLYGLNDNKTESVLQAFDIVDRNTPSILIFQKRPLHFSEIHKNMGIQQDDLLLDNLEEPNKSKSNKIKKSSQYISLLQRKDILNYCKNHLENKNSKFKINTVERLVYEEIQSLKTISFVQSLILKLKNNLNSKPFMKIIFSDLPLSKEIDFILQLLNNNFQSDSNKNIQISPKDFFKFMKLNLLFEKFLWLTEECGYSCPVCDKTIKLEMAHLKNENLIVDNFLTSLMNLDHLKVKNISQKIIKSIKLNDHRENTIVAFVQENYFYLTLERLIKDINEICEGKDLETIENIFTKESENLEDEFNHTESDWDLLIENNQRDKKEILNKIAVALNVYNNNFEDLEKSIKEFQIINDENKSYIKELFTLYKERLNYEDEINLWNPKKYDYKCYPNEILINKFLDSNKK